MYIWKEIKKLNREGKSIRKISKELKVSKNTVNKYINLPDPPSFKPREYRADILEYEEEVKQMLESKYIGTRIHKELKKLGYQRSISSLYRYLNKLESENKKQSLSTTRFETEPGEQMQYDWKHWTLPVKGKNIKIYLHQLILCYSRKKYCTFSLSITCSDIIRAIKEGIESFGGLVPELVIDNPKQMIITHEKIGLVRYNDEFLKFCGLYGIEPSPCKPYRARTKGKVERPFFYIQEHLLRGLKVESLSEFSEKLSAFIEEYNNFENRILQEIPNDRYWREINYLQEIPKVEPSKLFSLEARKVSNDGYVSFNGNYYPVNMKYALRTVFCESIYGFRLKVYDEKRNIILDTETSTSKERPVHPEHEKMNQLFQEKKQRVKRNLTESFKANFADVGEKYCLGLKKEHSVNMYWHMSEILSYLDFYSVEAVKSALERCLVMGSFHKKSVRRLLSVEGLKPVPVITQISKLEETDITRPLSAYGGLV